MKKPKNYSPNLNEIQTQKFMFEFLFLFKNILEEDFNLLEINVPSFFNEKDITNKYVSRFINFDTINDYNVYFLEHNYGNYLLENYINYYKNNYKSSEYYNGFFTQFKIIKRDQEADYIHEIESTQLNVILNLDDEPKAIESILKKVYLIIFKTYVLMKEKFDLKIELPKGIKVFDSSKQNVSTSIIDIDSIKYDLLSNNGILIWKNMDKNFITLEAMLTTNSEIIELAKIKQMSQNIVQDLTKYFHNNQRSAFDDKNFYFFSIDLSNILILILQKFSKTELFL